MWGGDAECRECNAAVGAGRLLRASHNRMQFSLFCHIVVLLSRRRRQEQSRETTTMMMLVTSVVGGAGAYFGAGWETVQGCNAIKRKLTFTAAGTLPSLLIKIFLFTFCSLMWQTFVLFSTLCFYIFQPSVWLGMATTTIHNTFICSVNLWLRYHSGNILQIYRQLSNEYFLTFLKCNSIAITFLGELIFTFQHLYWNDLDLETRLVSIALYLCTLNDLINF